MFNHIAGEQMAELQKMEEIYRELMDDGLVGVCRTTLKGRVLHMNGTLLHLLGFESVKDAKPEGLIRICRNFEDREAILRMLLTSGRVDSRKIDILTVTGEAIAVRVSAVLKGDVITATVIDDTERKRAEERLEEVSTALRVVMDQRDKDRKEHEEKIMLNVKELILPYVESLAKSQLTPRQKTMVETIGKNLSDITSSFLKNMFQVYSGFTPTEAKVASLIRDGKTAKEIAGILAVSESAVNLHRQHIRNKLGLRNEKENLRSRLLALSSSYGETH